MSLDITVRMYISKYSNENPINDKDYEKYYDDGAFQMFVLTPDWNDRISDAEPDTWYKSVDARDGVRYTYITHNRFRQAIADVVYTGTVWYHIKEGPFAEFLDFADNEGCITWTTCGKLYDDFVEWHEYFKKYWSGSEVGEYYINLYEQWMKDFADAHDTKGCIEYR